MFVIITVILASIGIIYFYLTWNFDYWLRKGVPGPNPMPLTGNFPNSLTQKKNFTYDFDDIYQSYKGRFPFVGIFSLRTPQMMIIDPEYVKDILIRKFKNFQDNEFANLVDKEIDPILSRNPFLLRGVEWREKRAEITPAFTTARIKAMYPLIDDVCQRMTKFIKKESNEASVDGVDTQELTAKFTTDVVSSCIFAVDAGALSNSESKIREMGKRVLSPTFFYYVYIILISFAPVFYKIIRIPFVPKPVEKFFTNLMTDAVSYREKHKIERIDYLHHLLQLRDKKNLSDLDLAAHAVTFFIDGYETSSIAMAYILYELARNNEIQDKLREEIKETITTYGNINFDNLSDMPYLDQILHEALRLHPPATTLSKLCTEECTMKLMEGRDIEIPIGMTAVIPVYSIHRDPNNYADADKFIPDRFDPKNGGIKLYRERGAFIPFGDGPRICLGMKFATAQVKAGIVEIIRNFELSVNAKTKEPLIIDPKSYVNVPFGGFWLNYKPLR